MKNYQLFRNDHSSGHGGGVLVYIKSVYNPIEVTLKCNNPGVNIVCCKFATYFYVICVYRPPTSVKAKLQCTLQAITDYIQQLQSRIKLTDHLIITGDFNLPEAIWSSAVSNKSYIFDFCNLFYSYNLKQIINNQTHGQSILDLIFIDKNVNDYAVSYLPPIANSDHLGISMYINYGCNLDTIDHANPIVNDIINYSAVDWNLFNDEFNISVGYLKCPNNNSTEADIEDMITDFIRCIKHCLINSYKVKLRNCSLLELKPKCNDYHKKSDNKSQCPWFDWSCFVAIKQKHWLYNQYKKTGSSEDIKKFKTHANFCKKIIHIAITKYQNSIALNICASKNQHIFWKHIKSRMDSRKQSPIIMQSQD